MVEMYSTDVVRWFMLWTFPYLKFCASEYKNWVNSEHRPFPLSTRRKERTYIQSMVLFWFFFHQFIGTI